MKKMQVFFFTVTFSPNIGISKSSVKLKVNQHNPGPGRRRGGNVQNLAVELTATEL